MADNGSSGPSGATIALVGLIATPIVLFLVFWLVGGSGGSAAKPVDLPNVQGKGLAWAKNEIKTAGFGSPQTYDSLGRDRNWRDDKQWQVCFETPAPGARAKDADVKLGVVKIEERCPAADQGIYTPATGQMPDLTNRTAFMSSKILGPDASVRYLDRENGDEVTRGLGDWRICSQSPAAGDRFDGLPVTTLVVKYEDKC